VWSCLVVVGFPRIQHVLGGSQADGGRVRSKNEVFEGWDLVFYVVHGVLGHSMRTCILVSRSVSPHGLRVWCTSRQLRVAKSSRDEVVGQSPKNLMTLDWMYQDASSLSQKIQVASKLQKDERQRLDPVTQEWRDYWVSSVLSSIMSRILSEKYAQS